MNPAKIFRIFILLFSFCLFPTRAQTPKEPIGSFSYTLGGESKTLSLKSLSVKFRTSPTGDPAKGKVHTVVNFSVNDTENNRVFAFTVMEDKVVEELKGQYILRSPGGINEGESLRSASIMIVDVKNSSNNFMTMKGSTSDISVSGTVVKITIKKGTVASGSKELPFQFALSTDKAKVKVKP